MRGKIITCANDTCTGGVLASVSFVSGEATVITVVSGVPRSGTSLLMQMLDAGGFPILCDAEFLDTNLEIERMAAVVDPALYRQRTA